MGENLSSAMADMLEGKADERETTAKIYELFYGHKPDDRILDEIMSERNQEAAKTFMKNFGGAN